MDAVQLFADLIAQRGKTSVGRYTDNPAFRQLADAGLIQEKGVVQSLCCDDCGQPHDAAVVHVDGEYGYFCPELGFVPRDRSDLVAVTPNLSAFVASIANDLNCRRRNSKPISGNTWRVGSMETHAGDIAVYFHPSLQDSDDLNDLKSALAKEVSSRYGIIITASGSLTAAPFVTIHLQDIMQFDQSDNQFHIDADIEAIAGIPKINQGGRPNVHKANIEKIMIIRSRDGRALEGRNAEAKGVLEEYSAHFPNEPVPSKPSVNRYVSEIRRGS